MLTSVVKSVVMVFKLSRGIWAALKKPVETTREVWWSGGELVWVAKSQGAFQGVIDLELHQHSRHARNLL